MVGEVLSLAVPNVDAFAEEVGVTRGTLYLWKNGKRNPTPENVTRLASALRARGGRLLELAEELEREVGE